ncbi:glycoside hydrolase family 97 protein [Emticicia oligotrophica]|uniref:glycoside hydrolase family 97 protein n=1 Tax=Emticicia oligotrophica TaxID=312279 RepID=UPI00273AC877|nr:glycoside hydrolase family 97 protein [Emticicia oligotrophica]
MKFIYSAFLSCFISYTLVAQSWQVSSPNAKIRATIQRIEPDGTLKYYVEYLESDQTQTVIEQSNLGISRLDQSFYNSLIFESSSTATIDENYSMLIGKQLQLRNNANEISLNFHNSDNGKFQVIFRAYNDGVAFRYRFPETSNNTFYTTEDKTTFQIPVNNSKTWIQGYDNFRPVYEKLYENGVSLNQAINQFNGLAFPALFQTPNAWILLTEADLDEKFFASHLSSYFGNGTFSVAVPSPDDGNSYPSYAGSTLPWTMPWRVIMIGKQLNNVVESNLVSHVSKASQIANTTWIQPGISTWSWWSDLGSPTNFAKLKTFIDLASDLNLPYSLIDANWNQMGNGGDINALITYANSKNVKLWLWYNSGGPSNDYGEQPRDLMHVQSARRQEFARIHALGIKGVKIDYFQSDKQELMKLYIDILKDAADYELMVNFHGNVIPKGWSRTYPNLVAMEAVKGSEAYIFDGSFLPNAPRHHTILPFTRNVIGPMDYTPTIIGWGRGVEHLTTDVHEIALLNTFESGVTHLVDMVASYTNLPTLAKTIISNLPTAWDETRLVEGFPGTHVVIARRKGENWYISGINGENQVRNITLPLSFIATGDYTKQLLSDGATPRDIATSEASYQVQTNNTISLNMQPYGGFMMVLKRSACQTTHSLTNQISNTIKYEASETIQANNIIGSTANVTYDAAKSILLTAGFQTQQGAIFKAYIDGCGNQ